MPVSPVSFALTLEPGTEHADDKSLADPSACSGTELEP
jgi:hypothetical protein